MPRDARSSPEVGRKARHAFEKGGLCCGHCRQRVSRSRSPSAMTKSRFLKSGSVAMMLTLVRLIEPIFCSFLVLAQGALILVMHRCTERIAITGRPDRSDGMYASGNLVSPGLADVLRAKTGPR